MSMASVDEEAVEEIIWTAESHRLNGEFEEACNNGGGLQVSFPVSPPASPLPIDGWPSNPWLSMVDAEVMGARTERNGSQNVVGGQQIVMFL
jgi:hypothetical protein